jgi:hypothetical protein
MWFKREKTPDITAADPACRRAAVEAGLVGQNVLRRLLHHDSDASVRAAAARRLQDLVLLRTALEQDPDRGVRESARSRYRQLLAGGDILAMHYRQSALRACQDSQIIAHVARSAREPSLRTLAVARLDDIQLLSEVAEHDTSPAVRAEAAARLDRLSCKRN